MKLKTKMRVFKTTSNTYRKSMFCAYIDRTCEALTTYDKTTIKCTLGIYYIDQFSFAFLLPSYVTA